MRKPIVPLEAIMFTAKMGFLSKEIWGEFFAKGSLRSTQRQWGKLVSDGWFEQHSSPRCSDIFVLTAKAKRLVDSRVQAIAAPPHMGVFDHDTKLSQIVLKMQRQGLILKWTTESELKILSPSSLKLESHPNSYKYPDLLVTLNVSGKPVRLAIELELSRKSFKRYRDIIFSYRRLPAVKGVFYICPTEEIHKAIKKAFRQSHTSLSEKPIGFGFVDQWLCDPAKAGLEMPSRLTTLSELIADIDRKRREQEALKCA